MLASPLTHISSWLARVTHWNHHGTTSTKTLLELPGRWVRTGRRWFAEPRRGELTAGPPGLGSWLWLRKFDPSQRNGRIAKQEPTRSWSHLDSSKQRRCILKMKAQASTCRAPHLVVDEFSHELQQRRCHLHRRRPCLEDCPLVTVKIAIEIRLQFIYQLKNIKTWVLFIALLVHQRMTLPSFSNISTLRSSHLWIIPPNVQRSREEIHLGSWFPSKNVLQNIKCPLVNTLWKFVT